MTAPETPDALRSIRVTEPTPRLSMLQDEERPGTTLDPRVAVADDGALTVGGIPVIDPVVVGADGAPTVGAGTMPVLDPVALAGMRGLGGHATARGVPQRPPFVFRRPTGAQDMGDASAGRRGAAQASGEGRAGHERRVADPGQGQTGGEPSVSTSGRGRPRQEPPDQEDEVAAESSATTVGAGEPALTGHERSPTGPAASEQSRGEPASAQQAPRRPGAPEMTVAGHRTLPVVLSAPDQPAGDDVAGRGERRRPRRQRDTAGAGPGAQPRLTQPRATRRSETQAPEPRDRPRDQPRTGAPAATPGDRNSTVDRTGVGRTHVERLVERRHAGQRAGADADSAPEFEPGSVGTEPGVYATAARSPTGGPASAGRLARQGAQPRGSDSAVTPAPRPAFTHLSLPEATAGDTDRRGGPESATSGSDTALTGRDQQRGQPVESPGSVTAPDRGPTGPEAAATGRTAASRPRSADTRGGTDRLPRTPDEPTEVPAATPPAFTHLSLPASAATDEGRARPAASSEGVGGGRTPAAEDDGSRARSPTPGRAGPPDGGGDRADPAVAADRDRAAGADRPRKPATRGSADRVTAGTATPGSADRAVGETATLPAFTHLSLPATAATDEGGAQPETTARTGGEGRVTGAGRDDSAATEAGGSAGSAPARMPVLTTAKPATAGHEPRGEAASPGQRPDDTGASTGAAESRTAGPTPPRLQHPTVTGRERTRPPDSEVATPPSGRVSPPSPTDRRAGERQPGTPAVDATGGPTTGPAASVPVIRGPATLPVTARAAMAGRERRVATDTGGAAASPALLTHLSPVTAEPGTVDGPDGGGGKPLIDGRTHGTAIQTVDMPSLTLQATGHATSGSDDGGRRAARTQSTRGQGEQTGARTTRQDSDAGRQDSRTGRDDHARRVERSLESRQGSRGERAPIDRERPPKGRDTATRYPELTVKTLAPRIDATRREDTPRDITHTDRTHSATRERQTKQGVDLDSLFSAVEGGSGGSRPPAAADQVVERLYRKIERKRRVERERRGL